MLLELYGEIPETGTEVRFSNFVFRITNADVRRIREVNVKMLPEEGNGKTG
jgi:Mg2+/Co2+ transporter CorC